MSNESAETAHQHHHCKPQINRYGLGPGLPEGFVSERNTLVDRSMMLHPVSGTCRVSSMGAISLHAIL